MPRQNPPINVKVQVSKTEPGTPPAASFTLGVDITVTFDPSDPDQAMQRLRELFDEYGVALETRRYIAVEVERQGEAALARLNARPS